MSRGARIGALAGLAVLAACGPSADEPREPSTIPAHFPGALTVPARNPSTARGVALGRRLFYDPIVSGDRQRSCATCHDPARAFTDGVARSTAGASGRRLPRNSPTLVNLAWGSSFFWDGGAADLESQAFGPLTHPDELGVDLVELTTRLELDPSYRSAFREAFGAERIESAFVARALAQFERSLVSASSPYDDHVTGRAALDPLPARGLGLFTAKGCVECHVPPLFTDGQFHDIGLDAGFTDEDEGIHQGRYRVTHHAADLGRFKTPTLRNVEVTGPYMHDGRFDTLEQVLAHYDHGVVASANLDPRLAGEGARGIAVHDDEARALVAFLHALTDPQVLDAPAHRPP